MNQPPRSTPPSPKSSPTRPDWLRPAGVAEGTWAYTQQRSIADHYGKFVADTPLCSLDQEFLEQHFGEQDSASELQKSCRIIDFGCGNGRSLIELATRGYETVGVDLSQSMLAQARHNAKIAGVGDATRWVRGNLVELDCLADDSANHAICMFSTLGMIQGRDHRRLFLSHARRIVDDGGTFVLHVHNVWSALGEPGGWARLAGSIWNAMKSPNHDFGDHVYRYRGLSNMFLHRFRWSELRGDLIDCGWGIIQQHAIATDGSEFRKANRFRPDRVGGYIVVAR